MKREHDLFEQWYNLYRGQRRKSIDGSARHASDARRVGKTRSEVRSSGFKVPKTSNLRQSRPSRSSSLSSSSKHRPKSSVGQDAGDCLALVTLNFDPSFFHRAPGTTGLLHLLSECLFFGQTDAGETRDDCHGLAASTYSLANDIHQPTVLLWCDGCRVAWGDCGPRLWSERQVQVLEECERIDLRDRLTTRGNAFLLVHRVTFLPQHGMPHPRHCPNGAEAPFNIVNAMCAVFSPSAIQICPS